MLGCEENAPTFFVFKAKKESIKLKNPIELVCQQKNKGFLTYARLTVYQKCIRIARKRPYR